MMSRSKTLPLLLFFFVVAFWCSAALAAEPSVMVVVKQAASSDGSDMVVAVPEIKAFLKKKGYTIAESGGQANLRIDVSGSVSNCTGVQGVTRYTLRLTADDAQNQETIVTVAASPNCMSQAISEQAHFAVLALFENQAYYKERENFFKQIRFYFIRKQNTAAPIAAAKDVTGPQILVMSPRMPADSMKYRGFPTVAAPANVEIPIVGQVLDPSKVAKLTLNGKTIDVDAAGTFRTTVTLTSERYPVILEAVDGVNNKSQLGFTLTPELANKPSSGDTDFTDKRIALVVGNGGYTELAKLGNPTNDAMAMTSALKSLGFEVIQVINGDREAIDKAVTTFGERMQAEKFTVGLFYYAGHGVQHQGENYLIPVEMKLDGDPKYRCINVQEVIGKMESANSRTNIIILDACRDDPFKAVKPASRGGSQDPKGLRGMDAPKGTFIAFATAPGQTAADGDGVNGTYTEALLKHIQMPNIPISSMFLLVRKEVLRLTGNKQTPWESTSLTDDFYFRR